MVKDALVEAPLSDSQITELFEQRIVIDGTNPKTPEELKSNRECVAEIDRLLEGYEDRIEKIRSEIVNRDELIEHFNLKSEDKAELETALKLMFDRVGMLQNAIVTANNQGNKREAFELGMELIEIRELRNETLVKIREMDSKE